MTELVSLGEVLTVDTRAVAPEAIRDGSHYVGLESIGQRGTLDESVTVDAGELKSSKFAFDSRHVLFGKLRPNLGKVARPTSSGICSTDIYPLLAGERLDRGYLAHFLLLPSSIARASSRTAGVNLPRISARVLKSFEIPLPPLPEQRRIAAILDQVEAARRLRRRCIAMLHELELAIFDSRFGSLVAAPSSVLSDVIAVDRPLTYGILMPGPDQSDGVPYVRVTDMEGGRIKVASVRRTTPAIDAKFARSKLEAGDLLMSIRGHVGRTATVPRELEGANITQDTARIAVRGAAQGYVKAWLGTPSAQEWMRKHTKGVAVQGINLSDVRRIPISLPSIDEQLEFVSEVDLLGRQRERAREHLLQLDELFASLQHRAFAGEL